MAASTYKDGINYDPKLPTAYRKATDSSKRCSTCAYMVGDKCMLWKGAAVRGGYLCAKWKDAKEGPLRSIPKETREAPEPIGLKASSPKETFTPRQSGRRFPSVGAKRRRKNRLKLDQNNPGSTAGSSAPSTSSSPTSRPAPRPAPGSAPVQRPQRPTPRRRNTNQQNRRSSGGGY